MKIGFLSSVEVGYQTLKLLYEDSVEISLVLSLHPEMAAKTSGFMNFEKIARENGSIHYKVKNINSSRSQSILEKSSLDLLIVCGFQRLLKEPILSIPRLGCVGFHASLLPAYRGRAPVNWAILEGAERTGVSYFHLVEEADAGDLIAQESFAIEYSDTVKTVYEKVSPACYRILKTNLALQLAGSAPRTPNPAKDAPLYPGRSPEDGKIEWNWPSRKIYNYVRALTHPYPGAYYDQENTRYFLWKVKEGKYPDLGRIKGCGDGYVTILNESTRNLP